MLAQTLGMVRSSPDFQAFGKYVLSKQALKSSIIGAAGRSREHWMKAAGRLSGDEACGFREVKAVWTSVEESFFRGGDDVLLCNLAATEYLVSW